MVIFHSYVNVYQRVKPWDMGYHGMANRPLGPEDWGWLSDGWGLVARWWSEQKLRDSSNPWHESLATGIRLAVFDGFCDASCLVRKMMAIWLEFLKWAWHLRLDQDVVFSLSNLTPGTNYACPWCWGKEHEHVVEEGWVVDLWGTHLYRGDSTTRFQCVFVDVHETHIGTITISF